MVCVFQAATPRLPHFLRCLRWTLSTVIYKLLSQVSPRVISPGCAAGNAAHDGGGSQTGGISLRQSQVTHFCLFKVKNGKQRTWLLVNWNLMEVVGFEVLIQYQNYWSRLVLETWGHYWSRHHFYHYYCWHTGNQWTVYLFHIMFSTICMRLHPNQYCLAWWC